MSETKLVDVLDAVHNSTKILERIVEATKYHENDYTLLQRRQQQHSTCYELILETIDKACCAAIDTFKLFEAFKNFTASTTALMLLSELYVRFFETEGTIANDSYGIGGDIMELLKCTQIYTTLLSTTKEKYLNQCDDFEKLQTLHKTMIEIKDELFLQRIQKAKDMPSKRQSLKLVTLSTSTKESLNSKTTTKQTKDWKVYYNPDLDPAINLLHSIDSKIAYDVDGDIDFSADGKLMAVANGHTTFVYNTETWAKECKLYKTLVRDGVRSVCFSSNGYLAAARGKSIAVWDISQQQPMYTLAGHSEYINFLTCSPDKNHLFSSSHDKTVKVWDMKQKCCMHTLGDKIIHSTILCLAVSPDGKLLATGSHGKSITMWDATTGAFLSKHTEHASGVNSVAFSKDGKLLASGSNDKAVKLWDISGGMCSHTLTHHKDYVNSVGFTSSNWLTSGSSDKRVIFCDLRALFAPCALLQDSNSVKKIAFSPAGGVFVTLSSDYTRVWKSW